MSTLTLVALTHQRTPFSILERATLSPDGADRLAQTLHAEAGVDEVVVLSTCNRTEIYLVGIADVASIAIDHLATHTGISAQDLESNAVRHDGDGASLHLFRVAAGLESRVIGEAEILGQVRAAIARATRLGTSGPSLNGLFQWAAATGRRARRDVGGSARPSLARTALDAAPEHDGVTLVLGAGAMAGAVVAELQASQRPYRVAARRVDRAARLTRQPHDAIDLSLAERAIADADVVVCATGARRVIVKREVVESAMARRPGRPLTIVDLSMPRNVAPDAADIDGVKLIPLQDLRGGPGDVQVKRTSEGVLADHDAYRRWLAGRAVGPVIAALRERITAICVSEAERQFGPDSAVLARRFAGQVLHAPTLVLKELSARGATDAIEAIAFVLDLVATDGRSTQLQEAS